MNPRGPWIQTFTGRAFFPWDPQPEDVNIVDVAHALSNVNRFTGHARRPYSVAQHSVLLSHLVPYGDAFYALTHDGAEAYVGDLSGPIKHHPALAAYRELEWGVEFAIRRAFGLSGTKPESIKEAHGRLMATEKRDLMAEPPLPSDDPPFTPYEFVIEPLDHEEAMTKFLARYHELRAQPCQAA